jgi:hypothetical protein
MLTLVSCAVDTTGAVGGGVWSFFLQERIAIVATAKAVNNRFIFFLLDKV